MCYFLNHSCAPKFLAFHLSYLLMLFCGVHSPTCSIFVYTWCRCVFACDLVYLLFQCKLRYYDNGDDSYKVRFSLLFGMRWWFNSGLWLLRINFLFIIQLVLTKSVFAVFEPPLSISLINLTTSHGYHTNRDGEKQNTQKIDKEIETENWSIFVTKTRKKK